MADLRPDRYIEASGLGLELYRGVAELPIVSPHGHIDVRLLADPGARLDPPGSAPPRSTTGPCGRCSPTTRTCSR